MSIHDGHRQRLRERFRREGLDNFDELQVLELLLFYSIARQDTNPLAHRLLDHFGSLPAVLDAEYEELLKVQGVSEGTATFLTMMPQLGRFYQVRRAEPGAVLHSIEECGNYLVPHFFGRDTETVFLLCMDAKRKVISCKKVADGNVNSASVPIRRVVEMALAANATSVVLAHNHPSGLAVPSADDIQTTLQVATALNAVEIALADHIIVSGDDFVSLVQSRFYNPAERGNL